MTARDLDIEAAEYALGTCSDAERRALDAERTRNSALDQAIAAWEARLGTLASSVTSVTPPSQLWTKIEGAIDALPDPRVARVQKDAGVWLDLIPGIAIKVLSASNADGTNTFLLKFEPGARLPAHQHPHAEECFIVDGTMAFGAETFSAGDYVAYPAGVAHSEVYSPTGGTVLIRGGYA
jgi:quercetin dioxygenase-like cupin family protein